MLKSCIIHTLTKLIRFAERTGILFVQEKCGVDRPPLFFVTKD